MLLDSTVFLSGCVSTRLSGVALDVVRIEEYLRPLRGGAASCLARCDRGLFVIKKATNRQGPNLLANELLGTELMKAIGLPVADWRFAVDDAQIVGTSQSLLHFASSSLHSGPSGSTFEVLPRNRVPYVRNRSDFIGVFVFDIWADSTDTRQAIFLEEPDAKHYRAVFIDQGHLFGGPHWTSTQIRPRKCLDPTLYPDQIAWEEVDSWIDRVVSVVPAVLSKTIAKIPAQWHAGDLAALEQRFIAKLSRLQDDVRSALEVPMEEPSMQELMLCLNGLVLHQPEGDRVQG